ncbi:MAG: metallophosphatase family protein [Pirellulales bacterium]|nr:metallophosphatase family protein [Pirellulales bacterium]
MKRAVISDIHGNLTALKVVLEDIRDRGIEQIYCLGDVVGYGPNPRECIDLVMDFDLCILGNHDQAALFDPEGFSSTAEKAIFWTREQLESRSEHDTIEDQQRRWSYLCELPRTHHEGDHLYVHGSARSPVNEYVFPEDVYNRNKIERIFGMIPKYCFQGHTHVPGVFTESFQFLSPQELNFKHALGDQKAMVNVGSVGQPRDGDPRSCYVIIEDDTLQFVRIEYPIQEVVSQIYAIEDLDNFLGDRLLEGK